eukprot:832556-Pelagomonas_calceolata.AAC.3
MSESHDVRVFQGIEGSSTQHSIKLCHGATLCKFSTLDSSKERRRVRVSQGIHAVPTPPAIHFSLIWTSSSALSSCWTAYEAVS